MTSQGLDLVCLSSTYENVSLIIAPGHILIVQLVVSAKSILFNKCKYILLFDS